MTTLPISSVWFDRETRQRRDLGDLSDLMVSIREVGLINPVVVTREGRLIAGERRFTACRELGWTAIPVTFKEDLSPRQLEQVELDENIKRLELPWQDRVRAVERYVQLAREEDPSETLDRIADRLGISPTALGVFLGVGDMLASGDTRIAEAPKFSVARGIWERHTQRAKANTLAEIDAVPTRSVGGVSQTLDLSRKPVVAPPAPFEGEPVAPIINANFTSWMRGWSGPKFNFIHCDFPYGIKADTHDQGAAAAFGGYEDGEDVYWNLLHNLTVFTNLHVADSAHLLFWFSMKFYNETVLHLSNSGWTVNPTPLIWHRSDNSGILPDPKRGPRQVYETALLASRGDRFIVRAKSNLIAHPNTKTVHMSEKPRPVLDHFFQMLVDEHTIMLDPTCGSGNSVIVANQLGAKDVLGIELNPEFHDLAVKNWFDNQKEIDV